MRTLIVNGLRAAGRRTGVGRQIQYLLQHWSQQDVPFDRVLVLSPRPCTFEGLGTRTRIDVHVAAGALPNVVWEQAYLPAAARGAALLLSAYTCPLLRRDPTVVSNYGIIDAVASTFSIWQRLRSTPINRASARHADCVIANSRLVRADLERYYGASPERIEVVLPGAAPVFFEAHTPEEVRAESAAIIGSEAPYLLFVGKLSRRRYVPNLIAAFADVRAALGLPHHLLLVGPNTSDVPIAELAAEHGVGAAVHHVAFLEQRPLARLYAGCALFVLTSTYEGFSQTLLEAMASGTAVLAVDHPALVEGPADGAFVLPTASIEDLSRGLRALLGDDVARRRQAARGRELVGAFSVEACARATMAILDRVAAPRDRRTVMRA